MAEDQLALSDLLEILRTADSGQFCSNWLLAGALQALIELEATGVVGAGHHERTATRNDAPNWSRPKTLTTAAGESPCRSRRRGQARSSRACWSRDAGSTAPRGDLRGVRARREHPQGRRPGHRDGRGGGGEQERGQPDLRRARRGAGRVHSAARWPARSPTCSPTRPTARCGWTAGSSRRRSWSPPACRWKGGGKCSAMRSATVRPSSSGPTFLVPARPRADRRAAGHQRLSPRPGQRRRRGAARCELATLPGPFPAQRLGQVFARATPRWSPPRSARSSRSRPTGGARPGRHRRRPAGGQVSRRCGDAA